MLEEWLEEEFVGHKSELKFLRVFVFKTIVSSLLA